MPLSLSPSNNQAFELHSYPSHFRLPEVHHPRQPISSSLFPPEPPSWSRCDGSDTNLPLISVSQENDCTRK